MDSTHPRLFDAHRELVLGPSCSGGVLDETSSMFTPGAWMRASLDAARAVMVAVDAAGKQITANDQAALTRLLNAEQRMLSRGEIGGGGGS